MIVRQKFEANPQLPPRPFIEQIMDCLTSSYVFMWDRKDGSNKLSFSWKDLSKFYNKNAFKTCLRKLNSKGLLDYEEYENGVSIELVGWDEIED